jgi:hypothetical protein
LVGNYPGQLPALYIAQAVHFNQASQGEMIMDIAEILRGMKSSPALPVNPSEQARTVKETRDEDFYQQVRDTFLRQSARYLRVSLNRRQMDSVLC